jgi:sulfite exporter TauE/SafE
MKRKNFLLAGALLIVFSIIYFLIQRSGSYELLLHLSDQRISYALIFSIGILASFHCVGMCGSFITAYSVAELKNTQTPSLKKHWQYNLGRLISYTASGLLLGLFGSAVQINGIISGLLLVLAGILMVIMGLSLLTKWQPLEKIKLKMPAALGKIIRQAQGSSKINTPFIIGLLTALMPCGPLQAMQLYALSTGNFWQGGLSMTTYALGTIPVMLTFGAFVSLLTKERIKGLLKISGAIVIILGVMTASRGASDFGFLKKPAKIINELSGKKDVSAEQYYADSVPTDKYQTVEMNITTSGFKPNIIHLKRNLPVRWIIKDGGITGCTNQVVLYNGEQELKYQIQSPQTIVKFMPSGKSEIKFSCGMKMVWGKFIFDNTTDFGK